MNDTMAEANTKDMARLRKLRTAASALREVLEDEEGVKNVQELIGAKLLLERKAEHIRKRWN